MGGACTAVLKYSRLSSSSPSVSTTMTRLCMTLILLVSAAAVSPHGRPGDKPAPRFTVDLDSQPRDRWNATITAANATIHNSIKILLSNPEIARILQVSKPLFENEKGLEAWFPGGMKEEILAMSELLQIEVGELVAISALYDVTASKHLDRRACTSVIVQNSEGSIIHGRTLDSPLRAAMLGITALVDFQRSGKTVFTSVSYLGMPGFNTVQRPGAFSISHDERDQGLILA